MKLSLIALVGLLANPLLFGQQPAPTITVGAQPLPSQGSIGSPAKPVILTRFDLDFNGGTPKDLVQAIEKASGKPLNLIIPVLSSDVQLPPLKLRGVTAAELFQGLQTASSQTARTTVRPGAGNVNVFEAYQFRCQDTNPRDESVWSFSSQTTEDRPACKFWQLGPYLESYQIEDITTAIQTGYKLLGEPPPSMNFHKDTRLLIAVGPESRLTLINSVLQQLQMPKVDVQQRAGKTGLGATKVMSPFQ